MGMNALVEAVVSIDANGLPDVHSLNDGRLQVLWVLAIAKREPTLAYLSGPEISLVLIEGYDVYLSRQKATAILKSEKGLGTVNSKKEFDSVQGRSKISYKIMKIGLDEIVINDTGCLYIDPQNALTAVRKFDDLLAGLDGTLKICDPYVESRSLDFLIECNTASKMQLLTTNINREPKFRRDLAMFSSQHQIPLEVRRTAKGKLHDRYIIHDSGMLMLGTSLNGLGKKQSMIVNVGDDLRRAAETFFDQVWASAKKFA